MAPEEPSKKQHKKDKETREVIGYPERPMPIRYVTLAVAAWAVWLAFLLVMAYIRWRDWPFWPT